MFINKTARGENNLCGGRIAELRKEKGLSQHQLAVALQVRGLDVDKNAIQRMEARKRFVTDIELVYICDVLGVNCDNLLDREAIRTQPIDGKDS